MTFDRTIGFVGGGNMAEALVRGLVPEVGAKRLAVGDPRAPRLSELEERYGVHVTTSNVEVAARSQIVVLAVKPPVVAHVVPEIADHLRDDAVVISVAAGVTIAAIEAHLWPGCRVIRAMPNTPALVRCGTTALSPGGHATGDDLAAARFIFDSVGISLVLPESQLDAVTGLSGSGPAYTFLILEALADAGVKVGLTRAHALRLAAQTVMGSARMLLETGEHPARLKDMVTSPGGTSIAGLHALEAGGLRAAMIDAVESATRRSRELGRHYPPARGAQPGGGARSSSKHDRPNAPGITAPDDESGD